MCPNHEPNERFYFTGDFRRGGAPASLAGRFLNNRIDKLEGCPQFAGESIGQEYGVLAAKGVDNTREEALNKAASIGATHIAWQPATFGYGSTAASEKAFRCTDSEAPK